MKAVLVKTHNSKPISKIIKQFDNVPELYEFLKSQGFPANFEDCVDDLQLPEVTYTAPVLTPVGTQYEQ